MLGENRFFRERCFCFAIKCTWSVCSSSTSRCRCSSDGKLILYRYHSGIELFSNSRHDAGRRSTEGEVNCEAGTGSMRRQLLYFHSPLATMMMSEWLRKIVIFCFVTVEWTSVILNNALIIPHSDDINAIDSPLTSLLILVSFCAFAVLRYAGGRRSSQGSIGLPNSDGLCAHQSSFSAVSRHES